MDETQSTESSEKNSGTGKIIGIIILVLIIVAVLAGLFAKPTLLQELQKSLTNTQKEVVNVEEQTQEAKQEVGNEIQEGLQEVGQAVREIDNPLIRLLLAKAYAVKLKTVLSEQGREDLNTIIVYVEKQPVVLLTPTPAWPAEVKTAIENVQTEIAKAKVKAVAISVAKAVADAKSKVGDQVELTGTWELVDQAETVGSVFMLTDTTDNQKYYFEMSGTAAEDAKELVGKEVTVTVKVTSEENGYVTYDVIKGPTEVVTSTSTPTPTEEVAL